MERLFFTGLWIICGCVSSGGEPQNSKTAVGLLTNRKVQCAITLPTQRPKGCSARRTYRVVRSGQSIEHAPPPPPTSLHLLLAAYQPNHWPSSHTPKPSGNVRIHTHDVKNHTAHTAHTRHTHRTAAGTKGVFMNVRAIQRFYTSSISCVGVRTTGMSVSGSLSLVSLSNIVCLP